MKQKLRSSAFLLLATVIWGSAFVAQSVGMDHVGPFTFQAIRCFMAVIGLLPIIALTDRNKKDGKTFLSRFFDRKLCRGGILCAIPLFIAVNCQQVGLVTTDAGKSAFLTAMYIVFVPVFGIFVGKKPSLAAIISVLVAVAGLYFLSCAGVSAIELGDILTILCAMAFAVQILVVDHYAPSVDGLRLNCLQCLFCAIGSTIVMFCTEMPTMEGISGSWWQMCYAGFLSMGVAYSLQIIGQKDLDPTLAALIMSLESLFAVLFGWLFLQETMTKWEITGCILMLIAILITQFPTNPNKETGAS